MVSLSSYLSEVPDFRKQNKNYLHDLQDILLLSVCAIFHGANGYEEIADFGNEKKEFLQNFLRLPNGIPSHDTIRRVFLHLDSVFFNSCFMNWISACIKDLGLSYQQISIDGKALRGSKTGIYLVSAVASELGLSLGQVQVEEKSNEITAIPALLGMLYLKGYVVSLDAMGTQQAIAQQIVEKEGDYFLALKGNQKHLLEQTELTFKVEKADDIFETQDWSASANQVVEYKVEVSSNCKWIENLANWLGLVTLIKVTTNSSLRGEHIRYYISSIKNLSAKQAYQLARGHWAIENKLHWQLDVILKEDEKRNRKDNSVHNLALVRKIILNAAKMYETKLSTKKMINKINWNTSYAEQLFTKMFI